MSRPSWTLSGLLLLLLPGHLLASLGDKTNRIPCLDKSPKYRKRPDRQVEVAVKVEIVSISEVNLAKMELAVDLHLVQEWHDERCYFRVLPRQESSVTLQGQGLADRLQHLWLPDTYISNAVSTALHAAPQPQQSTRVASTGVIRHRVRLSVRSSCPMDLHSFPFDRQQCSLVIQSYSLPISKVRYRWEDEELGLQSTKMQEMEVQGYSLRNSSLMEEGGERSCLELVLYFDRPLGYYLINIYSPAIFIVIMSWFNFWLNRSATPARITLGVTTVLTLCTLMAKADASLPSTAYPKAIEIYLWVCFIFTFAALVEFSASAYLDKRKSFLSRAVAAAVGPPLEVQGTGDSCRSLQSLGPQESPSPSPGHLAVLTPDARRRKNSFISRKMNDPKLLQALEPHHPDLYSRLLFPLSFVVFNVVYWTFYMTRPHSKHLTGPQ